MYVYVCVFMNHLVATLDCVNMHPRLLPCDLFYTFERGPSPLNRLQEILEDAV